MHLTKLDFEEFKDFRLATAKLKSVYGGGTATSNNTPGHKWNGADWIDDCTDMTTMSNGDKTCDLAYEPCIE